MKKKHSSSNGIIGAFKRNLTEIDKPLLIIICVLFFVGLMTCFSASAPSAKSLKDDSYYFLKNQLLWGAIGFCAMFFVAALDYKKLKNLSKKFYLLAVVLMVITLAMKPINGAKRWIALPMLTFQPSELAKIVLILIVAECLEKKDWNKKPRVSQKGYKKFLAEYVDFLKYFISFVPFAAILALQPHFSCFLIMGIVMVAMIFASGAPVKHFVVSALIGCPALLAFAFKEGYRAERITTFLDPFKDPLGSGYQTIQSLYAIGSGGFFGLGISQSRQKYLYLPEPQNDFVFSVLCEEIGFIGAVAVIGLFLLFVIRGFKIALTAEDKYGSLLAVGVTTLIAVEAFGNIAVVTATVPATGIPLPFFSAGGSSLVFLLAGLGILLSISKRCNR